LALGVAVEGILKTAFERIFSPSKEFLAAVDDVGKHLCEWKCAVTWDGESGFRKRMATCFTRLRETRADDRLRTLKELGVVTDEEFGAWKKLRNRTAHAHRPDRLPSQAELDEVSKVTTLMHKLVFQAIGYSGKYTDYATRGFPTRDYVCSECQIP
jgi:hypothetical protein